MEKEKHDWKKARKELLGVSFCLSCCCATHTIKGRCGKCHAIKDKPTHYYIVAGNDDEKMKEKFEQGGLETDFNYLLIVGKNSKIGRLVNKSGAKQRRKELKKLGNEGRRKFQMKESWGFLLVGWIFLFFEFLFALLGMTQIVNIMFVFAMVFFIIAFVFSLKELSDIQKKLRRQMERLDAMTKFAEQNRRRNIE